jgi:hypothetical protein
MIEDGSIGLNRTYSARSRTVAARWRTEKWLYNRVWLAIHLTRRDV